MSSDDGLILDGVISKIMKGGKTIVDVTLQDGSVVQITATLSGRMRTNKIRLLINDSVSVKVSPYDVTNGIIVWRQ